MRPGRNPPKVRSPVSLPPARSDRGRENSAVARPGERMRAGNFFLSQPVQQRSMVQNSLLVQSRPEAQHPPIREQPRLEREEDVRSVERCSVCELGSRTSVMIVIVGSTQNVRESPPLQCRLRRYSDAESVRGGSPALRRATWYRFRRLGERRWWKGSSRTIGRRRSRRV